MEYRRLGKTGAKVSLLGLGCNNFGMRCDYDESAKIIHQALDIGINHIDTANGYGGGRSEEFIGKAVKDRREQAFIATKFGLLGGQGVNTKGGSRLHLMQMAHDSLKRLGTDYIDLYYLHTYDAETPIEETLRGLDDLVRQGEVRYIGCSNFAAWQMANALETSKHHHLHAFACVQNHYNLLRREAEPDVVPFCKRSGTGLIPFFPLASGMLTGKYKQGQPPPPGSRMETSKWATYNLSDRNFKIVQGLEGFAKERGRTIGELAIAWLAANPAVPSIIAGATRPEQVVANAKGLEWKLTAEELKTIDALAPLA